MKVSITIEATKRPDGKTQILLERNFGSRYSGAKTHKEFFELSDSPDTELFLHHLRRIGLPS